MSVHLFNIPVHTTDYRHIQLYMYNLCIHNIPPQKNPKQNNNNNNKKNNKTTTTTTTKQQQQQTYRQPFRQTTV